MIEFRPALLTSLKHYSREKFTADLMAGIIVGIVALPLAIAFGIASGVSPEKGIITAIIAVHMDAVNHMSLSRQELADFVQQNKIQDRVRIPKDGESIKF